uniref:Uncharacterized protein n=1 Tax=Schistocephalus solidus TaxID=70667 RepID=A0A0X3Q3W3_SCHSO
MLPSHPGLWLGGCDAKYTWTLKRLVNGFASRWLTLDALKRFIVGISVYINQMVSSLGTYYRWHPVIYNYPEVGYGHLFKKPSTICPYARAHTCGHRENLAHWSLLFPVCYVIFCRNKGLEDEVKLGSSHC